MNGAGDENWQNSFKQASPLHQNETIYGDDQTFHMVWEPTPHTQGTWGYTDTHTYKQEVLKHITFLPSAKPHGQQVVLWIKKSFGGRGFSIILQYWDKFFGGKGLAILCPQIFQPGTGE